MMPSQQPAILPSTQEPVADDSPGGPVPAKVDFGIDLGSAPTVEGLRALWTAAKSKHAKLLEGMRPIIALRENSRPSNVELQIGGRTAAERRDGGATVCGDHRQGRNLSTGCVRRPAAGDAVMPRRRFRPSFGQIIWLAVVGVAGVVGALYLRYRVIEVSAVGLACDAGLRNWTCEFRRIATMMFNNSVFGYAALSGAVLNLIHPSVVLFTVGLLAGGAGVVLYNGALSGLALALLILSLARPAPEPE